MSRVPAGSVYMHVYRQEHACPRSEPEWVDKDQTTVIYKMVSFAVHNWASVSEPHTCDFNFLCMYISICDRHCTSKIAINISIFHLGSYTRRARILPRPARTRSGRPHPFSKQLPTDRGRAVNLLCSLCSRGIVLQV